MSTLNQILTIPGMDQSARIEALRKKSARQAMKNVRRIREAYARQSMMESLQTMSKRIEQES